MKLNVIIFGVTGMVGEGVLMTALSHPDVESILVIGRKFCGIQHARVKEILHKDFFDYAPVEESLQGYNACFFCLGVTSLGKNEQEYTRLTYDLTMAAAQTLCRLNPEMTFCYVSGTGTDSTESGRVMWARVKGKTENDLGKLPFKAVYLFRPGYIKPVDGQQHAHWFSTALAGTYPFMEKLLPNGVCTLRELGLAMIAVSSRGSGKRVLENRDIARLGSDSAE
ncbi:MAG: epimerase [Ignavibacteriales bacterium]|nr:epimerase [Ignavibacteriales bacterium]